MSLTGLLKWLLFPKRNSKPEGKSLQERVRLSEWAAKNDWKYDMEHTRWVNSHKDDMKTTEELFKLFNKSSNSKQA